MRQLDHIGTKLSLRPTMLMSSTDTDKVDLSVRRKYTHSQHVMLHKLSWRSNSSSLRAHNPANRWPRRWLSRRTTGSIVDEDYGGSFVPIVEHSVFGSFSNLGTSFILTCVQAETASFASPAVHGCCRCHLSCGCAVFREYCSVSFFVFDVVPSRSTTRPLYFWSCLFFAISAFLK